MKDNMDVHTHTLASGHAYNTITEMALEASKKGIEYLGITDHAPKMPGSTHEFYFSNIHVIPREMFGVKLLIGAELNILDYEGNVDLPVYALKKLDVGIASIHPPCFTAGTKEQNTNAIIEAMKNPYVNIIGHPDDGRFELDYQTLVAAAKEYGVIIEMNNSSVAPGGFRLNSKENDCIILTYCKEYKVPVIMNSDAHIATDIGNHAQVLEILEEMEFPRQLIVNYYPEMLLSMIHQKRDNN